MQNKNYTTKANIEAYLGETITASLDLYILTAQRYIDNYTGRNFEATGYIEYEENESERYYNGAGSRSLVIDPATLITKVEISNDEGLTFQEVTSFISEPLNELPIVKITLRNQLFPKLLMSARITGMFGWGEMVQEDITYVATVLASGMFKGKTPEDISSESIGEYSVSYKDSAEKLATVKSILDKYKILV